ncbi:hypothetical protein [Yoonia sp. BS5-3]|uniref:Uncharacterized protein n=1 Tax=Yoonia phaeophyticola TaxID=3137369 RepID=A0ABZ2V9A5_9RHOB
MDINTQNQANYAGGLSAQQQANTANAQETQVSQGIQAIIDGLPDAQRERFELVVKNLSLTPEALARLGLDPEVEATVKNAQTALSERSNFDMSSVLGRALVELGALQRKEALTDRLNAREAAKNELKAAAGELDRAAKATIAGAITNLVMSVVSVAISMAFAGRSGAAMAGAKGDAAVNAAASKAQTINMMGGAVNGVSTSLGGVGQASADAASKNFQADQNRQQADAEVTKSEGELEANEQQALNEFLSQIIQFIKELRDAEVEQLAVVTRG